MKVNLNFPILFCLFLLTQILFEFQILQIYLGYSDWEYYRRVASGEVFTFSYFNVILTLFPFGKYNVYLFYFILLFNSYYISKLMGRFKGNIFLKYMFFYNPFLIIMLSGIFKEAILFFVFFTFLNFGYFFKLFISLFFIFIRPHLYPFILHVFFNRYKHILLFVSLVIIGNLGLLDFRIIGASYNELSEKNFTDLPIFMITDFTEIYYVIPNFFSYTFYFLFTDSLLVMFYGFISFFYLNVLSKGGYKSLYLFVFFFNFYYLFFVGTSGIAFRFILFSYILYLTYIFFKKDKSI